MSRPRKAFGQQPGRLAATMLRALSAELSDPGRYSRGKGYARDGAVIDIEIRAGEVAGEVLGSRRDAYRVSLHAVPAPIRDREAKELTEAATVVALIPDRTEVSVRCTCPDGDGGMMCKHAIAVLLVFADEVSIEPDLLSRWRGGSTDRSEPPRPHTESAPRVDVLASMLTSPVPLPPMANLRSLTPHPITTPKSMRSANTDLLDELLGEALSLIRRR